MVIDPPEFHLPDMGMPNRKFVLLGITGLAGAGLLLDRTMLLDAAATVDSLSSLSASVEAAQTVAQTLDSGDPAALQQLLESLLEERGADPTRVQAGLFGMSAGLEPPGEQEGEMPAPDARPGSGNARVSMIISTPKGGLAVINGRPMREGQTANGLTLVAVHADRVVVEDAEGRRPVPLRP